jgi:hypothetical protein
MKAAASPVGTHHEDRTPTYGYEATRHGSLRKKPAEGVERTDVRQALASGSQFHFQNSRGLELVAPIPTGHQARPRRRRTKTSPHDNLQPQTFAGSVPRSKRSRSQTPQRQTIGLASHRGEPKTSGADRRISRWLGVGFPVATLNGTSESLWTSWNYQPVRANGFDLALQPK